MGIRSAWRLSKRCIPTLHLRTCPPPVPVLLALRLVIYPPQTISCPHSLHLWPLTLAGSLAPAAQVWCKRSVPSVKTLLWTPVAPVLGNEPFAVHGVHESLFFAPSCIAVCKGMISMRSDDPAYTMQTCSCNGCIRALNLVFLMSFELYSSVSDPTSIRVAKTHRSLLWVPISILP